MTATAGVIARYQKQSQDEGRQPKNALFLLDKTCYQPLSKKEVGRLFLFFFRFSWLPSQQSLVGFVTFKNQL